MSNLLIDFTDILAESIEAIEQGQATIESCLAQYPEHADELQALLPMMGALLEAPPIVPTQPFRQQARQRLLHQLPAQLSPLPNENVTFLQTLRHSWQSIGLFHSTRRVTMTWIIIIATVISIVGGGGAAAYAADAAVPGDALYALDLSLETLQIDLASNVEEQIALQLSFAEERLQEAQELIAAGDTVDVQEALAGYGEAISAISQTVETTEGANQEALMALVAQSLAAYDAVLTDMLPEGVMAADENGQKQPTDGEMGDARCSVVSDNPIAEQLATQFNVSAEEIMGYFCDGSGFGEIMLAYNISEQTDVPVSELLALREEGFGWGQIMQDAGVIGRPDDAGAPDDLPQGPPDNAGTPDDLPQGPPDNAGTPGDLPQGPPDNAGTPGDLPQGPPDNAGTPGDLPQGPPDNAGAPGDLPQDPPDNAGAPGDLPQGPPDNTGAPGGNVPPTMPSAPTNPFGGGGQP